MFNELALQIEKQLAQGSDFAIAQVVDRVAPSSGKVGDKALILSSGEMIGWIGGGCIRGIVIKEALSVMETKRFRRIRISPEGGGKETANFKEYVMSCQSKGTVEVLIEPVVPQPELIVVGKSNIARKLVQLAATADFRVTVMTPGADAHMFPMAHRMLGTVDFSELTNPSNTYIIVTTQGENDELSVQKALETQVGYVGFVASKRKSGDIRKYLEQHGMAHERINQLKSPVGLDINAKLASEVAISILAQVIDHFRSGVQGHSIPCCESKKESAIEPTSLSQNSKFSEEYYINPVCQVPVSKSNPKHVLEHMGEKVYFCCDGCKDVFEKNPEAYITAH